MAFWYVDEDDEADGKVDINLSKQDSNVVHEDEIHEIEN